MAHKATGQPVSVDTALKTILATVPRLGTERVPIREATGRVLRAPLISPRDLPPWDNSSVDGYALRAADTDGCRPDRPAVLRVIGEIPAGTMPAFTVDPGCAARIMTGAPLPDGADGVIMIEDTTLHGDQVSIGGPVSVGESVRRRGQDVRRGDVVIPSGRSLRPAEIGMAASFGHASFEVGRRPRVGVLATGDELVDVGEPMRPDRLYDVNSYAVGAQIDEAGGVAVPMGIAKDSPESLRSALGRLDDLDVLIVCGGVSVGTFDFVKDVLGELGMKMEFWRIAMKPGSPMAYGAIGGIPVFGLPGNPVSSMVTFEVFVRPALLTMAGSSSVDRPVVTGELAETVVKPIGKTHFVRVWLWRDGTRARVAPTGSQDSGVLRSMVRADGLLVIPEAIARVEHGQSVEVRLLQGLAVSSGEQHGM